MTLAHSAVTLGTHTRKNLGRGRVHWAVTRIQAAIETVTATPTAAEIHRRIGIEWTTATGMTIDVRTRQLLDTAMTTDKETRL